MTLLVRGGLVLLPRGPLPRSLLVEAGRIAAVLEPELPGPEQAAVVDATGLWVLPGAIDAHVHGRDPGFPDKEDFATLTAAAAAGGVTTVVDMPNTVPAVDSAPVLEAKAELVGRRARIDFGLWGVVRSSTDADAARGLLSAGAVGLKAYLGYAYRRSDRSLVYSPEVQGPDLETPPDYSTLSRLAPELAALGALLAVHAEDAGTLLARARAIVSYEDLLASRPEEAEAIAVAALGAISARSGLAVHIAHLSSAAGLEAALAARAGGADLSLETCPQYLYLTQADHPRLGSLMRMNPPVRREEDRAALQAALWRGEIEIVATDHAPHTDGQKLGLGLADAHPGSPGVQTLYLSCLELARRLGDVWRAPRWVSEAPARRLGLWPRKGTLDVGADADLVLVDPHACTEVKAEGMFSRQRHGALDGQAFQFAVRQVYARGELVFSQGAVVGEPGRGQRLRPQR